ncbi:hypothetical protein [Ligilactobacillus sp. Marseille-Q7487]|jgi:hypothetical protein|uniref:hypothetical protein n=1 Tax=Ligilactobacillus sp. Marseille-Q7487 TaxID=3022128 RepID=UPI0024A88B84|nr:hypothetical protein [Ligilactobacillus sp. Marseille-Q7487]
MYNLSKEKEDLSHFLLQQYGLLQKQQECYEQLLGISRPASFFVDALGEHAGAYTSLTILKKVQANVKKDQAEFNLTEEDTDFIEQLHDVLVDFVVDDVLMDLEETEIDFNQEDFARFLDRGFERGLECFLRPAK